MSSFLHAFFTEEVQHVKKGAAPGNCEVTVGCGFHLPSTCYAAQGWSGTCAPSPYFTSQSAVREHKDCSVSSDWPSTSCLPLVHYLHDLRMCHREFHGSCTSCSVDSAMTPMGGMHMILGLCGPQFPHLSTDIYCSFQHKHSVTYYRTQQIMPTWSHHVLCLVLKTNLSNCPLISLVICLALVSVISFPSTNIFT